MVVEGAAADLAGLDVERVEAAEILTALLSIAVGIIGSDGSHVELESVNWICVAWRFVIIFK